MAKDPICGMTVDEGKAIKTTVDGLTYYFCSEHCKTKFLQQKKPAPTAKITQQNNDVIYTCPMHSEIRQNKPGDCPKCGMHLEPVNPMGKDEEHGLIRSLSLKFWTGLFLTVPII